MKSPSRTWLIGGVACLGCGVMGFALGERRVLMTAESLPAPPPPRAPVPIVVANCPVAEDAGPPALPVKVALTEPRPGEGLDPPRVRPHDDRRSSSEEDARQAEAAKRAADEALLAEQLQNLAQNQAKQMEEMASQLKDMKAQLAAAQQNQQGHDDEAEATAAAHREAISSLQRAQASLALGSTDIDSELAQAEGVLSEPASAAIAKARQSLENDDLYAARQYLQQAMAADSSGSLNPGGMIPSTESGHGRH